MTFGQANGAHFNMYATRTDQNTERKTICILQTETYFFQTSPSPMMPILRHIDFIKRARQVDKVARVVFPLIFFLFNIGFWVFYLSINTDNKFWKQLLSKHLPKTTTCGINKKIFDALCSKHNYWDIDSGLATFYSNEHRDTPKQGWPLEDLMQARLKIPVFTPFIHVEHYILYFFQFLSFWEITLFYVLSAALILLILPTYSVWMLFSWNDWKIDRSSENAIRWHTAHF